MKQRRKGTAHDLQHTTSSVKEGGGRRRMTASGTRSLVFINEMTADRSSRMSSEACRVQIQPNAHWASVAPEVEQSEGWWFHLQLPQATCQCPWTKY